MRGLKALQEDLKVEALGPWWAGTRRLNTQQKYATKIISMDLQVESR
jgi:hypothetical protein